MGEPIKMIYHDFKESLESSHAASDLPIWEKIYSAAFPTMQTFVDHREDGEHQRAGIDRSVILNNSKQILIDEKIRWKPYPDILLEYWSNYERRVPGWVCKPLRADYICYAVAPLGKAYLLPVPQLQMAYSKDGELWRQSYKICEAKNKNYTTVSVAVPVKVLFQSIGQSLRISFDPCK